MKSIPPITPSAWHSVVVAVIVTLAVGWACSMLYEALASPTDERWALLAISLGVFLLVSFVIKGAFKLLSLKLSNDSIGQTLLFSKGRLVARNHLAWHEINNVMYKPGSYLLSNSTCAIEIDTTYFSKPADVAKFIEDRLPTSLRSK